MEIDKVKKTENEKRTKTISIRTFPSFCKWMKDNDVSPSKVFNEAIKELMGKGRAGR